METVGPKIIASFDSESVNIQFKKWGKNVFAEVFKQQYQLDPSFSTIQTIPTHLSPSKKIKWLLNHQYIPRIQDGKIVFDFFMQKKPVDLSNFIDVREDQPELEGFYYKQFEKAYEENNVSPQVFYLQKLSDLFLERKNYLIAAQLVNCAISITNAEECKELFAKLEEIEILFLGVETHLISKRNTLWYRNQLKIIRLNIEELIKANNQIQQIAIKTTQMFHDLLALLIEESITLLPQKPPTSFAIICLGSMSREEMCPYSDVEFAIILEEITPKALNYFRDLSRFLELRITNLGETEWKFIRPKVIENTKREEKSLLPSGFSMDIGGLCPLGKNGVYELIGTSKELANFQDPQWLKKNDSEIILVNGLLNAKLVYGKKNLLESYLAHVSNWLNLQEEGGLFGIGSIKENEKRGLFLLQGHVEEFKPYLTEERLELRAFDIKKDFYRPLQMAISGLLIYHGFRNMTTLEGIMKLKEHWILSAEGANRLAETFKKILNLRYRTQLYYRKEKEIIYKPNHEERNDEELFVLQDFSSLILDIYSVLIPLHKTMKEFIKNPKKSLRSATFYDESILQTPSLLHVSIKKYDPHDLYKIYIEMAALRFDDGVILSNLADSKLALGKPEEAVEMSQYSVISLKEKLKGEPSNDYAKALENLANALNAVGKVKQAADYYKEALDEHQCIAEKTCFLFESSAGLLCADILEKISTIYYEWGLPEEAGKYYEQLLFFLNKKMIVLSGDDLKIAMILFRLGKVYRSMNNEEKAIQYFTDSLSLVTLHLSILKNKHD